MATLPRVVRPDVLVKYDNPDTAISVVVAISKAEVPAPPSSEPSQSPAPPVIAVQKSERAVPTVPKILSVPPPIARLVVEAVVLKKLVEVAEVVVLLVILLKILAPVQE